MNIKKLLLISLFIGCLTANLYGQIYPIPYNFTVSKGEYADSIEIRWSPPTPPEFGEGFEGGVIPPEGWDTIATNLDFSWQIMDHPSYAHSGSYAACVPYTFSEGELLGFGENLIKNGDFSEWENSLPQFWSKSNDDITIESEDSLLAFSAPNQRNYVYQGISVEKYAKYKLSFESRQDSLLETYKIELYNRTSNRVLWSKDYLNNVEWETFEFDINTSSCDSIEIRLYPSKQGYTTYWDNISFEKYNYDPNQDETLITQSYEVKHGDQLIFWLGTSKTYGVNSPVYILVSEDEGETWVDTLLVCDGGDHTTDLWEYKEYSSDLSSFADYDSIRIGFRYIGGNGDLVCLDDVSISGKTKTDLAFFVVPVEQPTTRFVSRAPVNTKDGKATVLTGYSLERRFWHKKIYKEIFSTQSLTDTVIFPDTDVSMDTVYVYRAKAIYNEVIPSVYSNVDTGYVYDNSEPGTPYDLNSLTDWKKDQGKITLRWHKPESLAKDLKHYIIYDNSSIYDTSAAYNFKDGYIESDKTTFIIASEDVVTAEHPLKTKLYKFSLVAEDFAGNYSDTTEVCEILTPPKLSLANKPPAAPYGTIKVTISKWGAGDTCQPSDSIRIYRSTSDIDTTFELVKVLTDSSDFTVEGKGVYTDSLVRTDSTYYYYATVTYNDNGNFRESFKSGIAEATPQSNIVNISNLRIAETTDTSVIFQWTEPDCDSLSYGGVYVYIGENFTHPIDTISVGDTTYRYTEQGIFDFTFWPFDKYGVHWKVELSGLEAGNRLKNVIVNLYYIRTKLDTSKVVEDFEDGFDPLWTLNTIGDPPGIWRVGDNGSSQWFTIPEHDGNYAFVNDDVSGQSGVTECYLILPPITGLTDSDRVYLMFDSFFKNGYNESAYISIKEAEDGWIDIKDITKIEGFDAKNWQTNVINLSTLIDSSYIDSFQVAFHYDDNGTWAQGWAIDNVSLLSTSQAETLLGKKFDPDTKFYLYANYPNPFNPSRHSSTNFSFFLAEPAKVSLEIYNILGQKVRTVAKNEEFLKGKAYLSWDGRTDSGKKAAPGVYLYRIDIEGDSRVNKLMLLK